MKEHLYEIDQTLIELTRQVRFLARKYEESQLNLLDHKAEIEKAYGNLKYFVGEQCSRRLEN